MIKTVSLELAKQLKEAGYPKFGTYFAWAEVAQKEKDYLGRPLWEYQIVKNDFQADIEFIAAPTAEEILERLPHSLIDGDEYILVISVTKRLTECFYEVDYYNFFTKQSHPLFYKEIRFEMMSKKLTEALGKNWLHLKKEGLLSQ